MSITVVFEPNGRRGCFKSGTRILDAAKELGVGIRSECGGEGTCGKCRIRIVRGPDLLNGPTENERALLGQPEIDDRYRLSCQTEINEKRSGTSGILTVFVPTESRVWARKIQVKGMEQPVPLSPAIQKIHLNLTRPTLMNPTADDETLLTSLQRIFGLTDLKLTYESSKTLATVIRESDWQVTVTLLNRKEIIDIEPGDTTRENFGVAIDIGTSKIVGYLVDLNTGKALSAGMMENPQIQHGEDILSRIAYASQNPDCQEEMRRLVIDGINTVIQSACEDAQGIDTRKIHELTIVGNTAMTHLFLGIQSKFLSLAPYPPAIRRSMDVEACKAGLRIHPQGNVHVLPCVAGYVGADAVADVVATGIHERHEMSLLVDVGTNGEVFLGNNKELLSCSCAAGPAFEGTQIGHGMKAVTGAIEKVRINPKTLDVKYQVIGNVKPIGLCGSGMVDTVAELLKTGIISTRGRFNQETVKTERLMKDQDETGINMSFVIAKKDETGTNKNITVSAKDISEIQLAKSALHTGCEMLMQKKGVREKDIDHAYIAGAFGNYLNPENAKTIGLIPDIPTGKITFVGNTALAGAKMALTSTKIRELAGRLSSQIKYVELMAEKDFKKEFIASILLPHKDPNKYPSVRKYIGSTLRNP